MRKNPRRILSSTRTENKGLTAFSIFCYELPQAARIEGLNLESIAHGRTISGMQVGTKLGTRMVR